VLATQNPIESEGTYNLPEAQLDRFMFKVLIDYPTAAEEARVLKEHSLQIAVEKRLENEVNTIASPETIVDAIARCSEVLIADELVNYINQIVRQTREWPQFHLGASPRAGLALMQGARTLAAFQGRDYAIPDDAMEIALPALRHRVVMTAEAEVEGHQVDQALRDMIRTVEVPRM
jgi:MoxR-like ATPase